MTADLRARLRADESDSWQLCREAADAIDKLRKDANESNRLIAEQCERLEAALRDVVDAYTQRFARNDKGGLFGPIDPEIRAARYALKEKP